ncbi:hypothetical protein TWF788_007419 [Orbilia oligospora]|uniref:Aminotransferase class V domain-containing protein n=1 Tax=Orbilia oligospora TaxID=2813651 RepID=A0A6G1MCB5_ORBOL|nr:hypothetical protein TWF788_007419 [Orbilia oligospora]KAF3212993.1 hypothetical protein TWF679_005562 [Orbilia oligospora]KAF3228271.1 hypothetical protein TWF191_002776 [Orbilia oligospora]KAF3253055.1 hypothetical protein TWF192_004340 [Orbilia oligospora]
MRSYSSKIEGIRQREYGYLNGVTYLDHAGCTLYPTTLMHKFAQDLSSNLFGNPHSASPSSMLSSDRVETVRSRVLKFFNASPEHFDLVFVANATAGIKMVMDAFRDIEEGYWYGYHRDSHTSLVGVREHSKASRCFATDDQVEDWIASTSTAEEDSTMKLFAYPAQSNMNGRRSPLKWCGQVRKNKPNTYTLLDAAAYLTTGSLDLSNSQDAPDFTCMSFYKIFGFPDLGALIVRKSSADILTKRKYFGGGTVKMVLSIDTAWHSKRQEVHESLEDGTLPFHNIVALGHAMDVYAELYGTPKQVSAHASGLAKVAYERLLNLRYSNGAPVCEIYKDERASYNDSTTQGPTVAFNIRQPDGSWVGKSKVEEAAIQNNIHIRSGGVCNPGGVASFLQWDSVGMKKNFDAGMTCGDKNDLMGPGGKPTGIVRISLGAMSSMGDVEKFVHFVEQTYVYGGEMIGKIQPIAKLKSEMQPPTSDVPSRVEEKRRMLKNIFRNMTGRNYASA